MGYEIRQLFFNDNGLSLKKVADLQNIVYADQGKKFTPQDLSFWYLENPMGKVISYNVFNDDDLVAHYACIPIKMNIENMVVSGLLDMATVTHPDHRGKGLFIKLAKTTYDQAKKQGFRFVIGVANANSFPGYMKYFNFTFISQLEVKWGWGEIDIPCKTFSGYWTKESLDWRLGKSIYSYTKEYGYGRYGKYPLIKTLMGKFTTELFNSTIVKKSNLFFRPFNLYIGLGADLSQGHYFKFPRFIKHSPFNLIFLDLTDGILPPINKENITYQLIDFDIA